MDLDKISEAERGSGVSVQPIKCYAVMDDDSMDASVLAVYARREDAEARAASNNDQPRFFLDGEPATTEQVNAARGPIVDGAWWGEHVKRNDAREQFYDMHVEEFDFFGAPS